MQRDPLSPSAASPPPPHAGGQACLLALASSGAWTSVALLRADAAGVECDSLAEPAGADQSTRLLAMIGEVLGGRDLGALSAIAFDAGPGAFTGLRIGCSVAQGLGFARGLPLIEVGSLESAAWRSLRLAGRPPALALVANDARMGEIYASLCLVRAPETDTEAPAVEVLAGPVVCRPDAPPAPMTRAALAATRPDLAGLAWFAAGDAWHGIGLGAGWHEALAGRDPVGAVAGDAHALAELALGLWRAGQWVPAEAASPRYVRDKVALDVDEQRRLREQRAVAR
jgi:tRNA threonylcarbamoyladenosine biosynthesis protein TsaB